MYVTKRDGRKEEFNLKKIEDAIWGAAEEVGGKDKNIAKKLAKEVFSQIEDSMTVEEVQDIVEKVLIENGHAKTAKAYILYRAKRTREREARTELMDCVGKIMVETNRDNANIGESPSSKMLQIAMEASKDYYLKNLIPEHIADAHINGDIHIHDMDYYSKTLNCLQIDLEKLLINGFNTGYGYIRPPKRLQSAAALSAIILQSVQNDMYGGQSFPHFDKTMGNVIRQLDKVPSDAKEFYREAYQSMEALVYNLNSMHSLSGKEEIWIYDKYKNNFFSLPIEDFHNIFEENRFMAPSVNYSSGKIELKDVEKSWKHKNHHKILEVKTKGGQKTTVTDNHSMLTLENGNITTATPSNLTTCLIPKAFNFEKREDITYNLSCYPTGRKNVPSQIQLTPELAKFMGYYVAEGSVDGSSISLALFDDKMEEEVKQILSYICPDFSTSGKNGKFRCNVGKQFATFIADICGRGAENKKVPSEIFFVDNKIKKVFLDAYLTGDGCVSNNRIIATTVSKELRDGILLLCYQLSLFASVGEYIPENTFTTTIKPQKQYRISIGGKYSQHLTMSSYKKEKKSNMRVEKEQTPYDYEFMRPLIQEVYGIKAKQSYYYRITPEYLFNILQDLETNILSEKEEKQIAQLSSQEFWINLCHETFDKIQTSSRNYLTNKLYKGELPKSSKYLPIFFNYREMLDRFYLPKVVNESRTEISNKCQSPSLVIAWGKKILEQNNKMKQLIELISKSLNVWNIKIEDVATKNAEEHVYDISVKDNENFLTAEGIVVHNSRAGNQVPFSSINFGTDTTIEGRMVSHALLDAFDAGLGKGESPIFPNMVFKVKDGVNFEENSPNHDLFEKAIKVASRRLNPTFSFMDASFNQGYEDDVTYMGCRTRVIANRHGKEQSAERGNIAFTTVNLPRIALKSKTKESFFNNLKNIMELCAEQLLHRYKVLSNLKVENLPFLMRQKLYMGSEELNENDSIEPAMRNGTLSIGFIGLAETLILLNKAHHGESEESQKLGLEIIEYMRNTIDSFADYYDKNFTLVATPAEGLAGRFVKIDQEKYGIIAKVTNKDYYTNSCHIPVDYNISAIEKIKKEGEYHRYCNGGHISYVEFDMPPLEEYSSMTKTVVQLMHDHDVGYGGVNFPVDECEDCKYSGIIERDTCHCGSTNIRRIRRITGYLSTIDRFNEAKKQEMYNRVPHIEEITRRFRDV